MGWQHLFVLCLYVCSVVGHDRPVVETVQGTLRGKIVYSYTGKKILSFVGVRFAEPPTGQNRFKLPVPVKSWKGVRNAVNDGPLCPQPVGPNITVSEDCLFLNVHTKDLRGKRPVIIHIHSGGFVAGSGNNIYNGPQYFLDQDIVLVTFNYRLGPLGFLSTGDSVLPGNYGLQDQLLVLRWVKDNIAKFGGDPDSVTLYGYSAGAGSAHLHMLSPLSKGLFHKVIVSSCSATTPAVLNRDPASLARRFANILNCPTDTSEHIRDCLLRLPESNLTAVYTENKIWDTLQPPFSVFSPVVEKWGGEDSFLRDDPVDIVKSRNFTQVPMIIGITRDEFDWRAQFVLQNETYLNRLNGEFDEIAPWEFHYPRQPRELSLQISAAFKKFYFNNQPVSNLTEKQLGQLYADSLIIFSVYQAAKLFAEFSSTPVYFYLFTFEGRYSFRYKIGTDIPYGVGHHDDMIYLFYQPRRFPLFKETDPEAFMVRTLSSIFSNFASSGKPKLPDSDTEWLPMSKQHLQYLEISGKLEMKEGLPYPDRMKVWETQLPLSKPYRQLLY